MKNVMVVAHPDDECLWGAGMLLDGSNWDVICVARPTVIYHPERITQFYEACQVLGAKAIAFFGRDEGMNLPIQQPTPLPDLSGYDRIVTHNEGGEYGHLHHKQVHHMIAALGRDITVFGYGLAAGEHDITIRLSDDQLATKLKALSCYKAVWRAEVEGYFGRDVEAVRWESYANRRLRL